MKKDYRFLMALFLSWLVLVVPLLTKAGNPGLSVPTKTGKTSVIKWTVKNPFEQKVFIENKGQYVLENKIKSSEIFFGASLEGLQYYFSTNSIWISHDVRIKRTKNEIEQLKQQLRENENSEKKEDDNELQYKIVKEFHEMTFNGANPVVKITADTEVSWYYNFTNNKNEPIKAKAWKKLTYKNLYPGIDMEFYFPDNKEGFEYDFIVHPGGDVSQIKMSYPLGEKINTNDNNITVQSPYGDFIDHAPVATMPGSATKYCCAFKLNNGIITFNVGVYDKTKLLIIDPWTITPDFTGNVNAAFRVDWDNAGNSYIYGGSPGGTDVYELLKYDSTGKLIWSYITETFLSGGGNGFGDFTVNRQSGTVYISEGATYSGSEVVKLNSSGSLINFYAGNANYNEFWRILYSSSTGMLTLGGTGTTMPDAGGGEVFYMDTNFVSITVVDAFNLANNANQGPAGDDIWCMTNDKYGNSYVSIAIPTNPIVKLPLPNLTPTLWNIPSGYLFSELCVGFYGYGSSFGNYDNGFNGMACSCINLFTYDSYVLKKWSLDSGKLLSSLNVNGVSQNGPYWGGITSDDFGNIFLGSSDSLKQYSRDLQPINSIGLPNTIFDVNISDKNIVYVCGNGFLSAIDANNLSTYGLIPTVKAHVINPSSCVYPYGTAILDSPVALPSSSIIWNTTPIQFGYSAVNLSPGTYVVTIDYGCYGSLYDTVTIIKTDSNNIQFDTVPACSGQPVKLTGVLGESNYVWTPSTGLSSTSGSSVTANLSTNTTYSVISSFNSCYDTAQINVIVRPTPAVNVNPTSIPICSTGPYMLTASGGLSYQWSPTTGLSESTGEIISANPSVTTTYTVTGIDTSSGCGSTALVTINVGEQPNASFTLTYPVQCETQIVQFLNISTGGNNYLWNFGDGSKDTTISPTHTYNKAGNYFVTLIVTSTSGCIDSTTIDNRVELGSNAVYVPTAFTPAAENNNYFFPNVVCNAATGYEFRVYNRWGEMMYESTDPSQQGWDGRYRGDLQPMGTYVYYVKLECNGCSVFDKGDVTLLR